jgi:hypothetical protein
MKANTPWSGHYTVQPPLWIDAHVNQFARPGWKFINGGSRFFSHEGWSVMTLEDPQMDDYSIIIETMEARESHTVRFVLKGLPAKPLAVWQSAFKQFLFMRQADINPRQDTFTLTVQPGAIYSLTTTRGQHKGVPPHAIPPAAPFPSVWRDDFDHDSLNREPPFFINYHGAFEVTSDGHSGNRCLKQYSRRQGINWFHQPYPRVLFGDSSWKDTRMSVDFRIPDSGIVRLESRLHDFAWNSHVKGYSFEIAENGAWQLKLADKNTILQQGNVPSLQNKWHQLAFDCAGDVLSVDLDKKTICRLRDTTCDQGVSALATGWNEALFDHFTIRAQP